MVQYSEDKDVSTLSLDRILVWTEELHFGHVQCTVTKMLCKPCFSKAAQFPNTPSITPYDS